MTAELVFIHGWGFDARFWDALAGRLTSFKQSRADLGFFGDRRDIPAGKGKILVGHSLGFVHGINESRDWSGWIAINSFPRFVETKSAIGCTSAASLRDIRIRLQADPAQALKSFHDLIDALPPTGTPDFGRLREGLDELRDTDIEAGLKELDVPGLVLAGRNDPLVPLAASEALGKLARRGGLKSNDAAGHQLPQASPDWCAQAIADFVTACFDRA